MAVPTAAWKVPHNREQALLRVVSLHPVFNPVPSTEQAFRKYLLNNNIIIIILKPAALYEVFSMWQKIGKAIYT